MEINFKVVISVLLLLNAILLFDLNHQLRSELIPTQCPPVIPPTSTQSPPTTSPPEPSTVPPTKPPITSTQLPPTKPPIPPEPSPTANTTNKPDVVDAPIRPPTLVVYVFAESSPLKRANLEYFAKYGMCERCTNVEYFFMVNGNTDFQFPQLKNVRVEYRPNECGDFGAWEHIFRLVDRKKYKRLMFINDTTRGPFIDPHYALMQGKDFHFTDVFASYLTNDTKLVGSYINCGSIWGPSPTDGYSHVQTMAWMTDDVGLEVILPRIKCYQDKNEAVSEGEIGMSREMISKGYNIASMLYAYRGIDFRTDDNSRKFCNSGQDPTYVNQYFSQSVSPTEVIFFKNSRGGQNYPLVDQYTQWFGPLDQNIPI